MRAAARGTGTRFADWFVRDPRTGEVVVLEQPNTRAKTVYALRGGRWLLHRFGLRRGAPVDMALDRVTTVVSLVWAADEFLRGRSPLRRTVGAAVFLIVLRQWRAGPAR